MPSVTIDTGVLVAPPEYGSVDDTHRYIETLLEWNKLHGESWVAIYMSEKASEALLDDGLYPFYNNLRKLFASNGIVEYDVNTVHIVIDKLLQQCEPSFDAYFRVRDVLTEKLSIDPDILRLSASDKLQSDLARCLILIAILRGYCQSPILEHFLILRHAPSQIVQVRALVHDLEHDRDDLNAIPKPPKLFEGDVSVCDDFRGLIICLDESEIFRNATDDFGIEIAIRIALYKSRIERQQDPDWEEIPNLRIGRLFHQTAKDICSNQADSFPKQVLRAIVETLEKTSLSAVHALRTGSGGDNPQQMRGKDKAQRRNIDDGYRLHYWQCEGGMIELASIVPHDNVSIPK